MLIFNHFDVPISLSWFVDELNRLNWWKSYMEKKEIFKLTFHKFSFLNHSSCLEILDAFWWNKSKMLLFWFPDVLLFCILLPNCFWSAQNSNKIIFPVFCVFVFSATKVTWCCSNQLFFLTPLVFFVFLIDPSKLKKRCFYTFRSPQGLCFDFLVSLQTMNSFQMMN